jgi:SAM-dependent methyltransferase
MMSAADTYGRYSLGSGAILRNPDSLRNALADPQVIADYEASMRRDLAKSGIAIAALSSWDIMDVGTGRQALAFLAMGGRWVSHYDLSAENVGRLQTHINAAELTGRLETRCCDLVEAELGRDRFDFVYLNGVVQHFSNVGRGLVNCINALKAGGYLWLYFYRSGTFDNFVLYMLRTLASGSNIVTDGNLRRDYYAAARLYFSEEARDNYLVSAFMDGIFTTYARLYALRTYLKAVVDCGLEVVSSSGLDPLGRDIDHQFARAASVITLKKIRKVPDAELDRAVEPLAPEREVNQLDPGLYDDPEILTSLGCYQKLGAALASCPIAPALRMLSVLRLFAFLSQKTRASGYDPLRRHPDLQMMLASIRDLIRAEYGVL